MKHLSKLFVAALLFLLTSNLPAQSNTENSSLKEGIQNVKHAYLIYDKDQLIKVREFFENEFKKDDKNLLPLYYITLIDYKLLEISLRPGNGSLFDENYDVATIFAEKLAADKKFSADGKILSAGIYMMKIAANPMSGAPLSPKVYSLLNEAEKIDPSNPYIYLILGVMKFQTPQAFGGSYEEALKYFSKALKLYENEENHYSEKIPWGYVETFAWSGRSMEKLNNNETAKFMYKKALEEEPDYAYVKYFLLPKLEEKLTSSK